MKLVSWKSTEFLLLGVEDGQAYLVNKDREIVSAPMKEVTLSDSEVPPSCGFWWTSPMDKFSQHWIEVGQLDDYMKGYAPVEKKYGISVPVPFGKYYSTAEAAAKRKIRERQQDMMADALANRPPERVRSDNLVQAFAARYQFVVVRVHEVIR